MDSKIIDYLDSDQVLVCRFVSRDWKQMIEKNRSYLVYDKSSISRMILNAKDQRIMVRWLILNCSLTINTLYDLITNHLLRIYNDIEYLDEIKQCFVSANSILYNDLLICVVGLESECDWKLIQWFIDRKLLSNYQIVLQMIKYRHFDQLKNHRNVLVDYGIDQDLLIQKGLASEISENSLDFLKSLEKQSIDFKYYLMDIIRLSIKNKNFPVLKHCLENYSFSPSLKCKEIIQSNDFNIVNYFVRNGFIAKKIDYHFIDWADVIKCQCLMNKSGIKMKSKTWFLNWIKSQINSPGELYFNQSSNRDILLKHGDDHVITWCLNYFKHYQNIVASGCDFDSVEMFQRYIKYATENLSESSFVNISPTISYSEKKRLFLYVTEIHHIQPLFKYPSKYYARDIIFLNEALKNFDFDFIRELIFDRKYFYHFSVEDLIDAFQMGYNSHSHDFTEEQIIKSLFFLFSHYQSKNQFLMYRSQMIYLIDIIICNCFLDLLAYMWNENIFNQDEKEYLIKKASSDSILIFDWIKKHDDN